MNWKQSFLSQINRRYHAVTQSIHRIIIKILAIYFRIVPLPKSFTKLKSELSSNVIVTESSSIIIEALLYSFAKRADLNKIINLGKSTVRDKNRDNLKWISLHESSAMSNLLSNEIVSSFVTLNIFSSRGPFKSNPYYKLGFWDLLGILILGRFLIIFLGTPIEKSRFSQRGCQALQRALRVDLYKNLKLVRGTPFQPIETQANAAIGGHDFENELKNLSHSSGIALYKLKKQAKKAFYDIAANPRRPMYRIIAFFARFITERLFTSVQTSGLETLRQTVRDSTAIIVPMHRSHFDYILIGSKLYQSDLNPPLVAAGINLSFWPFGFIIRSVGGYFVKRNVRQDRLHALVLKKYVSYLVKRGHMQEFFIEGGRSRSGKMRQPKVGLLNVFLDAYHKGHRRDISFIPVSITYENVIEDTSYGTENTGRSKGKENLLSLIKASRIFKKSYGDVMINFGNPISLASYMQNNVGSPVTKLALQITRDIRDQTNPSLNCFTHTALLLEKNYGLTKQQLLCTIQALGKLYNIARSINSKIGTATPALQSFLSGQDNLLSDIARSSTIEVKECLGNLAYFIPGERRFTADFYKNSTIHIFLIASLCALSELLIGKIDRSTLSLLHTILEHDFMLDDQQTFIDDCDEFISALIDNGLVIASGDDQIFSSRERGIFIPTLVAAFFQSLYWVLIKVESLSTVESKQNSTGIEYNSLLIRLQSEFRTAGYLGFVYCTEASSSPSIRAALDTLIKIGIISLSQEQDKSKTLRLNPDQHNQITLIKSINQVIVNYEN